MPAYGLFPMGKPNSPKVQFWEGVVAVRRASSSHLGSFIRDAVKQFNDIATLRRIDALNEMTALYKKYQQELSWIGGNLNQVVKRYNAQQKAGVDEDFGRSAAQLTTALETAPYYAVCVTPAIHHTMGGLSVNTSTQVLKADGTPIPGLYAAGEVTGGLHGANRLGGNGVADIVVNGRLAGIAAARMFARLDS